MTVFPTVPWNASWTSEGRHEVRPCRYAGGRLAMWQPHTPGVGRPIFATPHDVRQRKSIAELRWTVCGERTPPADRWWFGLGGFQGEWWLTSEAPVHRACSDYALTVCPHLGRLGRRPEPMPPVHTVIAVQVGGDAVERDFGIRDNGRTIIGPLKLAWPRAMVRTEPSMEGSIA